MRSSWCGSGCGRWSAWETAGAIAAGDLSRRVSPAEERTEVGRLGLALNAMLARLERAFAERRASEESLRRFLADASHELRTPLASIRGYAELFRTGAARDGENTEKAMRRIEEEAARMGVLVEDLLTLARLEEQRPVAHERVDLAAIVADAADDARVTDRERNIEVDADGPAVLAGDAHQLRQLVGNLVRNALVHTPRAPRSSSRCAGTRASCCSRCATTAPACLTTTPTCCSSASGAPRPDANAARAEPAWGWR